MERDCVSAFKDTALDTYLRGLDIEKIIVVGIWINMAVEHTCRDVADYGYEVIIITDATSSMNQEWHEASLKIGLTNVTTQMKTKELLSKA